MPFSSKNIPKENSKPFFKRLKGAQMPCFREQ